jgi:hypothetical protein
MSFLTSSIVLPAWQIVSLSATLLIIALICGGGLMMVLSIPECRTIFLASMGNKYVLFNHSSYSTATLSAVKIDEISLTRKKEIGTKIRPRHKDDVERTQKINWIHSHELSPYPHSSTTAYIVDRVISELRKEGLPDTTPIIDALFRCQLDETKMIGFIEESVIEEEVITSEDGKIVYESGIDERGKVYDKPSVKRVEVIKRYQTQITESELNQLKVLKEKLDNSFVGVDSSGGDIFSFSHLSKIVDIGMAGTPADIEDLQHVAERKGMLKSKKDGKDLALYGIIFCFVCVGAIILLKGLAII